jgi:hypothetical protein
MVVADRSGRNSSTAMAYLTIWLRRALRQGPLGTAELSRISIKAAHEWQPFDGTIGAHIDWPDSKGLNEWELLALVMAEERSQLR